MEEKLKEKTNREEKMMKKYLSPVEVEKVYGLSQKWLANMRWEKKCIPYLKVGSKVLYRPSDIENYIESREIRVFSNNDWEVK